MGFALNMFSIPVSIAAPFWLIPQMQRPDPICDSINIEIRALNGVNQSLWKRPSNILARFLKVSYIGGSLWCVFVLKYKFERYGAVCLFGDARGGSRRPLKARVIIFHTNLARAPLKQLQQINTEFRGLISRKIWWYTDKNIGGQTRVIGTYKLLCYIADWTGGSKKMSGETNLSLGQHVLQELPDKGLSTSFSGHH